MKKGIVDIWGIPKLRIHLDPSFCLEIYKALNSFGNYPQIAKVINEPLDKKGAANTLINLKIRKSGPVGLIYKLGIFLSNKGLKKFHPNKIRSYIKGISVYGMKKSTIINPKIPFNFTTNHGCTLISALLHDGGISDKFTPHYWNTKIELREKVFIAAQEIFGELPLKFNPNSEGMKFPRVCGRILVFGLGLKTGNKIFTDPHIPEFVFGLSQEKISSFLRQAFDDDGTAVVSNYLIRITLSVKDNNKPPKLLIQIRQLLQFLGIESTKPFLMKKYAAKNDGIIRSTWGINILGRDNLIIFQKKINFLLPYKKEKLNKILTEVKEDHFRWNKVEENVLIAMEKIEKEYGYFNRLLVAKEIGRTWNRMQQIFPKLLKEGKIIQISKYSGTRSAKFKLNNQNDNDKKSNT